MPVLSGCQFYLGTHHPHWLASARVPLFVSRRALARYKTLPRATTTWALDSGGFSELTLHGKWTITAQEYADEVRRYRSEVGELAWAAPQDWMCEPEMLKRTGLSVEEHQQRTVSNFLQLCEVAPEVPWVPVLQGWSIGDYFEHAEAYEKAGVSLPSRSLVGLGTVCRRQHTLMVTALIAALKADGLRLHGFGFKMQGLRACAADLASADSLAWSYQARRNPPLPGHGARHKNCANCIDYALDWRAEVVTMLESAGRHERQQLLPGWSNELRAAAGLGGMMGAGGRVAWKA